MNQVNRDKFVKIGIVFVLAALLLLGGKVLAQFVVPATEPGGELVEMTPSYISGDQAFQNISPPDENPTSRVNSPAAIFSYYQVTGATLRGRSSATQYTYDGLGCIHTTAGVLGGNIVNTELHIPDHAVIKYLRVYYNDTNPGSAVIGFITKYNPGVAFNDLVYAGSTDPFNGGFGYVVSQEITETVDNNTYAYALSGLPAVNNIANQICGLRVAYIAPFAGIVFMPVVRH